MFVYLVLNEINFLFNLGKCKIVILPIKKSKNTTSWNLVTRNLIVTIPLTLKEGNP